MGYPGAKKNHATQQQLKMHTQHYVSRGFNLWRHKGNQPVVDVRSFKSFLPSIKSLKETHSLALSHLKALEQTHSGKNGKIISGLNDLPVELNKKFNRMISLTEKVLEEQHVLPVEYFKGNIHEFPVFISEKIDFLEKFFEVLPSNPFFTRDGKIIKKNNISRKTITSFSQKISDLIYLGLNNPTTRKKTLSLLRNNLWNLKRKLPERKYQELIELSKLSEKDIAERIFLHASNAKVIAEKQKLKRLKLPVIT